jgi:hypothetical protein
MRATPAFLLVRRLWPGMVPSSRRGRPHRTYASFDTPQRPSIASGGSVKHVHEMLGHKHAAMTLDDVSNRLAGALLEAAAA